MELGEKLRLLRESEGLRRGLWRAMTQREVVRALRQELGVTLSQAYLSQLESGARVHLSNDTREALARFYHTRPSDLMGDPAVVGMGEQERRTVERLAVALSRTSEPERALRLVERLLALGPEALSTLETALAAREDATQASHSDQSATSARPRS